MDSAVQKRNGGFLLISYVQIELYLITFHLSKKASYANIFTIWLFGRSYRALKFQDFFGE
jgi:hypothetical protein